MDFCWEDSAAPHVGRDGGIPLDLNLGGAGTNDFSSEEGLHLATAPPAVRPCRLRSASCEVDHCSRTHCDRRWYGRRRDRRWWNGRWRDRSTYGFVHGFDVAGRNGVAVTDRDEFGDFDTDGVPVGN